MKLMQGSEAVVAGALKAGMEFFAGYPITPANKIVDAFIKMGIGVLAEDEIAAINLAIGARIAGKKSMVATSGPGLSLMQESISYAIATEIPLVIVNVQRCGPATGMPTLASQGDVYASVFGSHGGLSPVVFYPSNVEELYTTTIHAFNIAEKYRTPVVLLSDAFLIHLTETCKLKAKPEVVRKHVFLYKHSKITGLVNKDGEVKTEDLEFYEQYITKLKRKLEGIKGHGYKHIERDSSTLIVCYGFIAKLLNDVKASLFVPIRIHPFPEKELKRIAKKYERIVVVESNTGLLKNEIERILRRNVTFVSALNYKKIRKKLRWLK